MLECRKHSDARKDLSRALNAEQSEADSKCADTTEEMKLFLNREGESKEITKALEGLWENRSAGLREIESMDVNRLQGCDIEFDLNEEHRTARIHTVLGPERYIAYDQKNKSQFILDCNRVTHLKVTRQAPSHRDARWSMAKATVSPNNPLSWKVSYFGK